MLPVLHNPSMLAPLAAGPISRLDSLFDRALGDDSGVLNPAWSTAPVTLWADDDAVHVEADLPGVSDQDVEVTVHHGMLFIRGERKPVEGRRYLYNGRPFGRFERVITLPEAVKTDDVQARLADGVLSIDLPKSPEARPRKITLQTS